MVATTVERGSPQFPQIDDRIPPTSHEDLDAALDALQQNKDRWVKTAIPERIEILNEVLHDMKAIIGDWVQACIDAKNLRPGTPEAGDEWIGNAVVFRVLRQLRQSLDDIQRFGRPRIAGPVTARTDGQVVAQVFPTALTDRILFSGMRGEVWMQPEVTLESLPDTQAESYRDKDHPGKVMLVLAAGNVASLGPTDFLYKLFVEDRVCIVKVNPVNAYIGPHIEAGFRALIKRGFLRIVYGGAEVGNYLAHHDKVDELHLTGSDKTFEAILFGPGEEGQKNKAARKPKLTKRFTAELGNVSPVIIVPGPWSDKDLDYHGQYLASTLVNNAGFNCVTNRVIIQHAGWDQRGGLNDAITRAFESLPTRKAYYPGAADRHSEFVAANPDDANLIGEASPDKLPWTFITGIDPADTDNIAFKREAFCSLFSETALAADSIPEYIDAAVAFANNTLWGTLGASIIVHPASLKDPAVAAAVDRAVANLRYGVIGVNTWNAFGYFLGYTSWGGHAGSDLYDVQSGIGVVNNTLMFGKPQKSVVRAPFRVSPNPLLETSPIFETFCRKYLHYEADPSPLKLPGLLATAIRA